MRALRSWLAASLLLMMPGYAFASPCGGSSGGSSDGSSGGSSGGSSSGSSGGSSSGSSGGSSDSGSSGSSSGCVNTSSIVGRAECTRFGSSWDRQTNGPMRFTMGITGGSTSVEGMEFDGSVSHDRVHDYHYPTEQTVRSSPEQVGLGGFEMQGTAFITEQVHLGFHAGFAVGGSSASERQIGELTLRPGVVVQFSNAAIVGVNIPVGNWAVRSDALVGVRSTNLSIESQRGDCIQHSSAWNNELLLEPRVGIERWLNPWLSAGVMVGSDLMQSQDLSISVGLTGHTTPRDSLGVVGLGQ